MKKLVKRLVSSSLALMMSFGGTAFAAEKQSELPLTTTGETLVIYCDLNAAQSSVYSDLSEHPVVKKMSEETGINFEFMHPPVNDDGTFFNTTIASCTIPTASRPLIPAAWKALWTTACCST